MKRLRYFLFLFPAFLSFLNAESQQKQRVLAISGGGSRGAWGGAVVERLVKDSGRNYQCVVGTSSGSLLAPLIVLGSFDKMKIGFTEVDQKSIFNKNPFRKNGKIKAGISFIKVLFGVPNLGETKNLKKRIKSFFDSTEYQQLKNSKKTIIVSTVSLTTNTIRYRSSDSIDYERMVNWVWASSNQPVFMTPVLMDNEYWIDGGVKENVPIKEAINYARAKGIDSVDVIVLNTLNEHTERWPKEDEKSNIIPKILRTINIFSDEIKMGDIEIGILLADEGRPVILSIYEMTPKEYLIAPQSLLFTKKQQQALWKAGSEHVFTKKEPLVIQVRNDVKIIRHQ